MEKWKPGTGKLFLLSIAFSLLIAAAAADHQEWELSGGERAPFILEKSQQVVKTDGGEIRVFRGRPWRGNPTSMHVGFINMEPNTLLIPQYIDANLVLFLRRGEGKIGWIHKDDLVERRLKAGDVLRIPAGSAFYLVNTGKGQQLQIICSIDPVEPPALFDWRPEAPYRSFFIGGGDYPRSVLAGFDISTLSSAFNATPQEVRAITEAQATGPIVFVTGKAADRPNQLAAAVRSAMEEMKQRRVLMLDEDDEEDEVMEEKGRDRKGEWTWAGILSSIFFGRNAGAAEENKGRRSGGGGPVKAHDAYNLYDREPDFRNRYGWSIEVNEHDYKPLKKSDMSVYLVNLTAGAMVAPHVNPRATEYGVVVAGEGTVEVVYPNGTAAMREEVREGDVFFVPRFLPFCQVAARGGPMELFGFTTSARRNRPQFLVGARSILRTMMGAELAAGFGLREEELRRLVMTQNESVILPSWLPTEPATRRQPSRREKGEDKPRLLKNGGMA